MVAEYRTVVEGGIPCKKRPLLGKMRPFWAICMKTGQKCPRMGKKKFNHQQQTASSTPTVECQSHTVAMCGDAFVVQKICVKGISQFFSLLLFPQDLRTVQALRS